MSQITELELRTAVRKQLARDTVAGSRVLEELGIERGKARIDVAVISHRLEGYEIKSDLDTMTRFSNQIHAYNRVFEHIHLVIGARLAEEAVGVIPSWWGIIVGERDTAESLVLRTLREPRRNPVRDAISIASLLWKDEAHQSLECCSTGRIPSRYTASRLHEMLAVALSMDDLQAKVVEVLKSRAGWRNFEPSVPNGDLWHLDATFAGCLN